MKKLLYLFFIKSQLIVTYLFGIYLIAITIFAFDRKEIDIIFNYGFWFVFGCFIGFYWAIFTAKYINNYNSKKKPFEVLRNGKKEDETTSSP